ncbi:MAG: hypothetical protein GYA39_04575 [Methanothrix sp.]|nr:hypothetical protein [Methanothrix sp.]
MTLALSNHDPEITASRLKELPNGPMTAKEIGLHHGLITSLALRGIIRSAGRTRIYYTGRDGRKRSYDARIWICGPCWKSFAERRGWNGQSEVPLCQL